APTTQPTTKPTTAPTTQPTTKPTTAPTTQPTTKPTTEPTVEPTLPSFIYGDANLDKTVDVRDVTAIQYSLAKIQALASNDAMLQAEVTGDFRVNINDATMIQLYIAGFITKFPVEEYKNSAVKVVSKTATASYDDTMTLVKNDLEKYYTYSSYDQYMALKKSYRKYNGATLTSSEKKKAVTDLTAKQEALYEITGGGSSGNDDPVTPTNPTGQYTVYFTNDQGWSSVKAYVWGTAGEMAGWPGKEMSYASTNKYGQKIYSISFDYKDYQKIIFTNGSGIQTVDIVLTGEPNIGYYVSGSSGGKLTCSTYTYP
ncbi:MAG: starch-binding protein, partial [Ruminococcus sp.]|nr:starch-binding protein [Ruminococcus sp.]